MLTDDVLDGRKRPDLDRAKEIKVKVPVRLLLQLHLMKMVQGQEISSTVQDALAEYFDRVTASRAATGSPTEPVHAGVA